MPTLALPPSPPPTAVVSQHDHAGFDRSLYQDVPHGPDTRTLHDSFLQVRGRKERLAETVLAPAEDEESFATFGTAPPLRTYFIEVIFERGVEIAPLPYDFIKD